MNDEDKIDVLSEALRQILNWCTAYPIKAFPEPDWRKVRMLLDAGGVDIAAVTGSNMRFCLEGVGAIAMAALEAIKDET